RAARRYCRRLERAVRVEVDLVVERADVLAQHAARDVLAVAAGHEAELDEVVVAVLLQQSDRLVVAAGVLLAALGAEEAGDARLDPHDVVALRGAGAEPVVGLRRILRARRDLGEHQLIAVAAGAAGKLVQLGDARAGLAAPVALETLV